MDGIKSVLVKILDDKVSAGEVEKIGTGYYFKQPAIKKKKTKPPRKY